MLTRIKNHFSLRFTYSLLLLLGTISVTHGQVSAPTVSSSPTLNITPGLTLAGTMNNATNQDLPGWTQRLYGSNNDDIGIDMTSTILAPAFLRFDTTSATAPNIGTSRAADNFEINGQPNYTQYRWNVFRPATVNSAPSTSKIFFRRTTDGSFINPTDSAQLANYNTWLNDNLKFQHTFLNSNQPGFINPDTGAVIVPGPTVGWFEFEFSNFTALGYRNIDLVFTVAPEPGTTLAIAAAGLGLIGGVGRRLRKSKNKTQEPPASV